MDASSAETPLAGLSIKDTSSLAVYEYQPLPKDETAIRILRLIPGHFDQDVIIELTTILIAGIEPDASPYQALSYTWGSPKDPGRIYIQSGQELSTLFVTRNCEEALRYLRREDGSINLWVDAVCINQQDQEERAQQVSIMRSIYSKGSKVIVWLGPASGDSKVALEWIDSIAGEITYDPHTQEMRALTANSTRLNSAEVLASDVELEAFANLIERAYFDRLWVWQEVRMGGERVRLRCGYDQGHWDRLMTTVFYCNRRLIKGHVGVRRLTPRTNFLRYLPLSGRFGIIDALEHMRLCKCADQRDRVYTIEAFSEAAHPLLQVTIDYKVSVQLLYILLALRHLCVSDSFEILLHVGDDVPHSAQEQNEITGLPSWVPNWARRNTAERLTMGIASGFSRGVASRGNSATQLKVRGVSVGTVMKTHGFGHDLLHPCNTNVINSAMHAPLQAILPRDIQLQTTQPNPQDRKQFRQVVRVLTQDNYAEHFVPASSRPTFLEAEIRVMTALWNLGPKILSPQQARVMGCFYKCLGRTLFICDNGRIGLGPGCMQKDDDLAVILGCPNVMVLRRAPGEDHYHIVGNAVCSGLMDGEALLGPLPDECDAVSVLNEQTGQSLPAFRDSQTGEVTYADPRLPRLDPKWVDVSADRTLGSAPLHWRNEETGQVRHYLQDPRLDVDALERRGVQLEDFILA